MAITLKKYKCPTCGAEYKRCTNHFGEIYVTCQTCGGGVLYCAEAEAEKMRGNPDAKAIIKSYNLNLSKPNERQVYYEMCKALSDAGYEKFRVNSNLYLLSLIAKNHLVYIWKANQFDNQYVTNIGRLHGWYEGAFANDDLRVGYYLEVQKSE